VGRALLERTTTPQKAEGAHHSSKHEAPSKVEGAHANAKKPLVHAEKQQHNGRNHPATTKLADSKALVHYAYGGKLRLSDAKRP
jgi:hypothetical protein